MKIGIDFGTTKTLVSWCNPESGSIEIIPLGRGTEEIPTTLHFSQDGKCSFGDDADDLAETDSEGFVLPFKPELGKDGVHFTRCPPGISFSAEKLTGQFLRHIKTRVEESDIWLRSAGRGAKIDDVTITIPVAFSHSPARKAALERAASVAGFRSVEFIPEPEAAARAWLRTSPDDTFQKMLVIDWGGGTLDLALVERDENGGLRPRSLGAKACNNMPGGEEMDRLFALKILDKWRKSGNEPPFAPGDALAFLRLRRSAKKAKEQLSEKNDVFVRIPGGHRLNLKLTQEDLHDAVASLLEEATAFARQFKAEKADALLLVGGTCQMPAVRESFAKAFPDSVILSWNDGRRAVALGASNDTWRKGVPHPLCLYLVASENRGMWVPLPGYVWKRKAADSREVKTSDTLGGWIDVALKFGRGIFYLLTQTSPRRFDNAELEVEWDPGRRHPTMPHIVSGKTEGSWVAAPGYQRKNPFGQKDLSVIWKPGVEHGSRKNVVSGEQEGSWIPVPGYYWKNTDDKLDFEVVSSDYLDVQFVFEHLGSRHDYSYEFYNFLDTAVNLKMRKLAARRFNCTESCLLGAYMQSDDVAYGIGFAHDGMYVRGMCGHGVKNPLWFSWPNMEITRETRPHFFMNDEHILRINACEIFHLDGELEWVTARNWFNLLFFFSLKLSVNIGLSAGGNFGSVHTRDGWYVGELSCGENPNGNGVLVGHDGSRCEGQFSYGSPTGCKYYTRQPKFDN